jgi:hypothetical protein
LLQAAIVARAVKAVHSAAARQALGNAAARREKTATGIGFGVEGPGHDDTVSRGAAGWSMRIETGRG